MPRAPLAVVCWSGICGLGSIEIGSLGSSNTLPFDHKSGSPDSQLGLLPDINKPPLYRIRVNDRAFPAVDTRLLLPIRHSRQACPRESGERQSTASQRGICGTVDRGPLAPRQGAVSAPRPKTTEVKLGSLTSRIVPRARAQKASNVTDGLQRTPQRKRQVCRAYSPRWWSGAAKCPVFVDEQDVPG
jgi:hypothetical protein